MVNVGCTKVGPKEPGVGVALQQSPRKWCTRGQVTSCNVLSGGSSGLEQAAEIAGNTIWLPGPSLTGVQGVQHMS